jgi:hypothetical protein
MLTVLRGHKAIFSSTFARISRLAPGFSRNQTKVSEVQWRFSWQNVVQGRSTTTNWNFAVCVEHHQHLPPTLPGHLLYPLHPLAKLLISIRKKKEKKKASFICSWSNFDQNAPWVTRILNTLARYNNACMQLKPSNKILNPLSWVNRQTKLHVGSGQVGSHSKVSV